MSGTSSEKRRLDGTREELRDAGQSPPYGCAQVRDHLDDGEYGPDPGATATADQAAQTVKRPDGNGHVIAS